MKTQVRVRKGGARDLHKKGETFDCACHIRRGKKRASSPKEKKEGDGRGEELTRPMNATMLLFAQKNARA